VLNVQVFNGDENNYNFSIIKQWTYSFTQEISLYADRSLEEPWQLYSESSMLGFLANGIIRSDKNMETTILQEFRVNNSGAYHGRCDMLIFHNNDAFIVEGKFAKGSGDDNYVNNLIQVALHQVEGYYNSEAGAYKAYNSTKLIALVFYVFKFSTQEEFEDYCARAKTKRLGMANEYYAIITPKEMALSSHNDYAGIEVHFVIKETSK
jgi:hypothetical protein